MLENMIWSEKDTVTRTIPVSKDHSVTHQGYYFPICSFSVGQNLLVTIQEWMNDEVAAAIALMYISEISGCISSHDSKG